MKMKIETGSFDINVSGIVVEVPSIKIEAEYSLKETAGLYDLTKKAMEEVPAIAEKFVVSIMEAMDRVDKIADARLEERTLARVLALEAMEKAMGVKND